MRGQRIRKMLKLGVVVTASVAILGVAGGTAASQTSSTPGVSAKDVTLGYIAPLTGVAAPGLASSGKACQARIDAQNAEGGVNGRKIKLEVIDDKSSAANLTAAKDLVENRNVFAVVDNSALAFLTWRYLKDQGVPMIGAGIDGSYYYDEGNEGIISGLGDATPVPGLVNDNAVKMMKKLGATKIGAVGYGQSPASGTSAKATETYAADAQGVKGVYLNTALDFGSTDVGPVVLGLQNAGADGVYLPLAAGTNFAIVDALRQNGVEMKANVLATGYGRDLLTQPVAKNMRPQDLLTTPYKPVELGGSAVKEFQSNLKKYAGLTGVPVWGDYSGYILCDMAIVGLKNAGKSPTRQGFVDGIRNTNGGQYDGAGLLCKPYDLSYKSFGKTLTTNCTWFVTVKDGKFVVANDGKPVSGKIVGDPALLAKYTDGVNGATATTAAPAS